MPERDRWYNKRWVGTYRLTYESFHEVLGKIRSDIEPERDSGFGQEPISAAEKLAVCLYFLGHGGVYDSTVGQTNRCRASVQRCVVAVCAAIMAKLAPEVVKWPAEEEMPCKV